MRRSCFGFALIANVGLLACALDESPTLAPGTYALLTADGKSLPAIIDSVDAGSYAAIKQWVGGSIEVVSRTDAHVTATFHFYLLLDDGTETDGGSLSLSSLATIKPEGHRFLLNYQTQYSRVCGLESGPVAVTDTLEVVGGVLLTTRRIPACELSVPLVYHHP